MSEDDTPAGPDTDPVAELRARAEELERRLAETEQEARGRILRAELKVEAVRAGMVDLDGLKLLDLKKVELDLRGRIGECRRAHGATAASEALVVRWHVIVQPSQPAAGAAPRQKLATEMTDEEYRAARAAILKHQS